MNVKKTIALSMCTACLLLFAVSSFMLFSYFQEAKKQENAFHELEQIAAQDKEEDLPTDTADESERKYEAEETAAEYESLHEKNQDYWGWLKIDGTPLSYPVMHTPNDPEHYLRRDFEGNYSSRGVPFLDGDCSDGCGNYIIYGHHMKDGTMFGSLLSYAKQEYYADHSKIQLNTKSSSGSYTILAVFYSKAYNQEDTGVFRYYQYTDIRDPDVFNEYIDQVKAAAIYDTGITAEPGEQLLTLSTCSYHEKNGRFVVVAVQDSAI